MKEIERTIFIDTFLPCFDYIVNKHVIYNFVHNHLSL